MHAVEAQKPWKGTGMEGWVAHWYPRTRRNDTEDFRREAVAAARRLRTAPSLCGSPGSVREYELLCGREH
jgi:hypothetical protein